MTVAGTHHTTRALPLNICFCAHLSPCTPCRTLQVPLNKLQDQTCKRVLHAVRHNRLLAEVSAALQQQSDTSSLYESHSLTHSVNSRRSSCGRHSGMHM